MFYTTQDSFRNGLEHPVTQEMIAKHGRKIDVVSKFTIGTKYTITIPK